MGGKKKYIEMFSSFTEPFSYSSVSADIPSLDDGVLTTLDDDDNGDEIQVLCLMSCSLLPSYVIRNIDN